MRKFIIGLSLLAGLSLLGGCTGEDATTGKGAAGEPVSQSETMEEIWASDLAPAEKAKRVRELLASSPAN